MLVIICHHGNLSHRYRKAFWWGGGSVNVFLFLSPFLPSLMPSVSLGMYLGLGRGGSPSVELQADLRGWPAQGAHTQMLLAPSVLTSNSQISLNLWPHSNSLYIILSKCRARVRALVCDSREAQRG